MQPQPIIAAIEEPDADQRRGQIARLIPLGGSAHVDVTEWAAVLLRVERPAPQLDERADQAVPVDAENRRSADGLGVLREGLMDFNPCHQCAHFL